MEVRPNTTTWINSATPTHFRVVVLDSSPSILAGEGLKPARVILSLMGHLFVIGPARCARRRAGGFRVSAGCA